MSVSTTLTNLVISVFKQLTYILSVIGNVIKIYSLRQETFTLKELIGFITAIKTQYSRTINQTFNNLSEKCKNLLSVKAQEILNSLGFFTWITDQQKEDIIGEIEKCRNQLVNSIFFKELFCASALTIIQIISLVQLSTELKEKVNLAKDSKLKIGNISKKLDDLERDQIKMSQEKTELSDFYGNREALKQLSYELRLLKDRETDVCHLINQVKAEINEKMVRLNDKGNGSFCDACMNTLQVTSNIIEYNMAGEMYSKVLVALKLFTTTICATIGLAKYQQSQLALKKAEELSEILRQIDSLESQIESIKKEILSAMQ